MGEEHRTPALSNQRDTRGKPFHDPFARRAIAARLPGFKNFYELAGIDRITSAEPAAPVCSLSVFAGGPFTLGLTGRNVPRVDQRQHASPKAVSCAGNGHAQHDHGRIRGPFRDTTIAMSSAPQPVGGRVRRRARGRRNQARGWARACTPADPPCPAIPDPRSGSRRHDRAAVPVRARR